MQGLARLGAWVDEVAAALCLPSAREYALRLCLEEAVANVVMHGRPVPGEPEDLVTVRLRPTLDALCLTIEDRCAPFDPLCQPAPRKPPGLRDGPGGWGIHLMRQFARGMTYQRADGVNRLNLTIGG